VTTRYRWHCACSESGTGEAAAQRHAAVCDLMGRPGVNPDAPAWKGGGNV
jgi:hypothetical protein